MSSRCSFTRLCRWAVGLLVGNQRPNYTCVLVGECDAGLCCSQPLLFVHDPEAALVDLALGSIDDRPGPVDQQGAQVGIAALADAEQPTLAAAGVLPGNQA